MKRTFISKILFITLFLLLTSSLMLLFSMPKALILDKLLTKRGINLMAGNVEESVFGLKFKGVRLFLGSELFADPDTLSIELSPAGLLLKAGCGKGYLKGSVGVLGSVSLEAVSFMCLTKAERVDGKVELTGSEIFGKLSLYGLKIRGVSVDSVDLEFNGRDFKGNIGYKGVNLSGGGTIKLKPDNLEDSELNALFKGSVGELVIKGKLSSPRIQIR